MKALTIVSEITGVVLSGLVTIFGVACLLGGAWLLLIGFERWDALIERVGVPDPAPVLLAGAALLWLWHKSESIAAAITKRFGRNDNIS